MLLDSSRSIIVPTPITYALLNILLLFGKQIATISSPFVGLLLILLYILIICILRSCSNLDALTLPLVHLLALKCSRSVSSLMLKLGFVLITFVLHLEWVHIGPTKVCLM